MVKKIKTKEIAKDSKKTFTEKIQDKSAKNAAMKDFQNQEHNSKKEGLGPNTKR